MCIPIMYYICPAVMIHHLIFNFHSSSTLWPHQTETHCSRTISLLLLIFILTVCSFNFANNLQTLLALILTVYIVSEISKHYMYYVLSINSMPENNAGENLEVICTKILDPCSIHIMLFYLGTDCIVSKEISQDVLL